MGVSFAGENYGKPVVFSTKSKALGGVSNLNQIAGDYEKFQVSELL